MKEYLALFVKYKAIFPDEKDGVILSIIEKELKGECSVLRQAIDLGVCLIRGVGSGTQIDRIKRGIALELALREKIRVNNNSIALSKGKPCPDHVNAFRSDPHPYTLDRYKRAIAEGEKLAQANAVKNGGNQSFGEK